MDPECGMRGLWPEMLGLAKGEVALVLTYGHLDGVSRLRIVMLHKVEVLL